MLLDDLADVLSSGGIGTVGTTLFKGLLPPNPPAVTAVFAYGGAPPVWGMAPGPGTSLAERPRAQIVCRDTSLDAAEKQARDAWLLLDGLQRTINGVVYHAVYALQSPFQLMRDENNRESVAFNVEIVRKAATSS